MTDRVTRDDDVLSRWLRSLTPSTAVFCRAAASAPFGFSIGSRDIATFHVVTRGEAWLEVEGVEDGMELSPGDVVLLPTGAGHRMRDAPGSPVVPLDEAVAGGDAVGKDVRFGGNGAATVMVCGGCTLGQPHAGRRSSVLPPVIRRPGDPAIVELMERESARITSGNEAILIQLLALLVTQALRDHLASRDAATRKALLDPDLSAAVALIHDRLDSPIRIEDLCERANMSRTVLNARFRDVLGTSPIEYLRLTRLSRAADMLSDSKTPIRRVARSVGYSSAASFSRAFRREYGVPPGEYRTAE